MVLFFFPPEYFNLPLDSTYQNPHSFFCFSRLHSHSHSHFPLLFSFFISNSHLLFFSLFFSLLFYLSGFLFTLTLEFSRFSFVFFVFFLVCFLWAGGLGGVDGGGGAAIH